MSLIKEGYLSTELDWTRKVRQGFPTYTRLAKEMSDLCQCVIFEMSKTLRRSDPRSTLAIASTIRMAEFLQAAIVLIERGMVTASRTSLRSGFETAFFLGGLVEIPDFIRLATNENAFQTMRLINAEIALSKYVSDPERQAKQIAMLQSKIEETKLVIVLLEGEKLKGWNWKDIADKGGLGDAYDTFYRSLSTDAAHTVFHALSHLFDKEGAINYGPATRDYFDTFYFVMALGDVGLSQSNALLNSVRVKERLTSLHQQTMTYELSRESKE